MVPVVVLVFGWLVPVLVGIAIVVVVAAAIVPQLWGGELVLLVLLLLLLLLILLQLQPLLDCRHCCSCSCCCRCCCCRRCRRRRRRRSEALRILPPERVLDERGDQRRRAVPPGRLDLGAVRGARGTPHRLLAARPSCELRPALLAVRVGPHQRHGAQRLPRLVASYAVPPAALLPVRGALVIPRIRTAALETARANFVRVRVRARLGPVASDNDAVRAAAAAAAAAITTNNTPAVFTVATATATAATTIAVPAWAHSGRLAVGVLSFLAPTTAPIRQDWHRLHMQRRQRGALCCAHGCSGQIYGSTAKTRAAGRHNFLFGWLQDKRESGDDAAADTLANHAGQ